MPTKLLPNAGISLSLCIRWLLLPNLSDLPPHTSVFRARKYLPLTPCDAKTRTERPFEITGAVVLPDHIHFLWTLPPNDSDYSQRVSRLKILFTPSLRGRGSLPQNVSDSRRKHRESDVWQRRFWEHVIKDEADQERHLEYIH